MMNYQSSIIFYLSYCLGKAPTLPTEVEGALDTHPNQAQRLLQERLHRLNLGLES